MPAGLLAGLLWKIAGPVISQVEAKIAKALSEDPPLYRAIALTGEAFPDVAGVNESLKRWCESVAFRQTFEALKDGQRELTDDEIVQGFIHASEFYYGEQTNAKASGVVEYFLSSLEDLLYASDRGLVLHANREEVLHAGTLRRIDTLEERLPALISAGLKELTASKNLLPSDDLGTNPEVQEKILHAKTDQARDLIKDGKPSTARSILEGLRSDLGGASPSADLLFRIATNLGVCALHLDENEIAIKEFREALRLQPGSAKALSNASIAAFLNGDLKEAITLSSQARTVEPKEINATSVLIQSLHGLSRKEELKSLLAREEWIEKDPACCWVIGELRLRDGDYERAERLLRNSISGGNRDPNVLILLGKVIVDPVLKALREDVPLPWRMPEASIQRIEEAEKLLDEAVGRFSHYENRARLHDALANRCGVRCALRKTDLALKDCDRVLAEDESHLAALHNKAHVLLAQGKFADAIPLLETVASKGEDDRLTIILATAYSETDAHQKAISLLEPLWQPGSRERNQIEIAGILARQYSVLGEITKAAEVISVLAQSWPDDPHSLLVTARQLRMDRKNQEALALLDAAWGKAVGSVRDWVALEKAELHFSSEEYAEAAKIFGEIVDKTRDNPSTRKYVISLYNSQQFQEALHAARAVRLVEGAKPEISEIEALILESIGDPRGAIQLWSELNKDYPENVKYRLGLARLDFRCGNRESARNRLSAIQFDEIKDNAEGLIQVAQERALLGMPGVLPLVYRARQIDFGNPSVHLAYFSLFFSREDLRESSLTPQVVGADCVVHLKRGTESLTFTILKDSIADQSRNELSMSDTLATKLLGLQKGDHVVLKDTPLEQLSYEVVEIQSKYVHAFQQSLNEFTTRFPDHPGFYRVEFKENDFSRLLTAIDKRHEFITQLTLLYQQKGLPLSTVSKVAGTGLVEAWAGMMGWQTGRVRTALGSLEERNTAEAALAGSREIVADLVALLTVGYLELLDRLPKRFGKIFVPQAVLDEINLTLADKVLGGRPSGTLGKSGDYYFHREITSDELARGKKFLEGLRDFVESCTEVIPVASLLDVPHGPVGSLRQILPECAIASVLAARERSTILFSDNLGLRQVAESEWKVTGVWVQTVLSDLLKNNVITKDEYHVAVEKLILANYFFVSINHDDILYQLKKNGWDISREMTKVFATLRAPDCDEDPAVALIADLIRAVWLEPIMDCQKQMILDLALNALTTSRLSARVILKLKVELNRRFALLPIQLQAVIQTIRLWHLQNLARQGLVR